VEWILIIGLCLLSVWLGLRYRSLLKGVRQLSSRLGSEEDHDRSGAAGSRSLQALARTALSRVHHAERAQRLEAGRRSLLETLLNQIEDALFLVAEDGEILLSNEAARTLYPTEKGQEGRPLIQATRDHRLAEVMESAVVEGRLVTLDFERQHRAFRIEAAPLGGGPALEDGGGLWILIRDVTEQRDVEQTRRDFVANASHELRTPLAIIRGYLEMLEGDPAIESDPGRQRAVEMMAKHGDRINRTVDDMLAISSLESGVEQLAMEPFNVCDCLRDAVEHLLPLVDQSRAEISLAVPDAGLRILGDRFYWDQMLVNLIENAIKQNPQREVQIEVICRVEERDGAEPFVVIEVVDDGIGIPTADLPHVFKRFYRVAKDHSQARIKGTGLGLSIVKRAIEAHSGTVEVESEPGVRTVFRLAAPVELVQVVHE